MSSIYPIPAGPCICLLDKHNCANRLVCMVQKPINRNSSVSGPAQGEKQPTTRSCWQSYAFYIITMFIGFLFSLWQKGHLPTAVLKSSSKTSYKTCCGTKQRSLTYRWNNSTQHSLCCVHSLELNTHNTIHVSVSWKWCVFSWMTHFSYKGT